MMKKIVNGLSIMQLLLYLLQWICLIPTMGGSLKSIVAPLVDPEGGCVCTLYKATSGDRWFEKMELPTFNADFIPSVIFAHTTGASHLPVTDVWYP